VLGKLLFVRLKLWRVLSEAVNQAFEFLAVLFDREIFRLQLFRSRQEFGIFVLNLLVLSRVKFVDVFPHFRDYVDPGRLSFVDPRSQLARHDRSHQAGFKSFQRCLERVFGVDRFGHESAP